MISRRIVLATLAGILAYAPLRGESIEESVPEPKVEQTSKPKIPRYRTLPTHTDEEQMWVEGANQYVDAIAEERRSLELFNRILRKRGLEGVPRYEDAKRVSENHLKELNNEFREYLEIMPDRLEVVESTEHLS